MTSRSLAIWVSAFTLSYALSAAAFPNPHSVREGYQGLKVIVTGTRTVSQYQRSMARGVSGAHVVYRSMQSGDNSNDLRQLLTLAQARGDISLIQVTRLGAAYRAVGNNAPNLLARCLNSPGCDHQSFLITQQRSSMHRLMSWQLPHLSPTAVNHKVGELNERVMNAYYTSSSWRQLPGEVGRNGIDGLFVKYRSDRSIRDVLVSESKYNFSPLGNTQHGRQMSQQWTLRKIDNLYRTTGDSRYLEVRRFVEQGTHRNILWRLMPSADSNRAYIIQRQRIRDDSGILAFDNIRGGHRMLVDRAINQSVDIAQPVNAFQSTMALHIQRAFDDIVAQEQARIRR
ncbi:MULTISPECIES: hypothetical protein [unclassified Halomonas]|uniref:hypothetical protein n=1 Tax=unclassified Halomonas TaxID=2609666 RepID=UPI004034F084